MVGEPETPADNGDDAFALTSLVLAGEEERRTEQARRVEGLDVDSSKLPGVGGEAMSLGTAVARGGKAMLLLLFLLVTVEEFDRTALAVLAPDIQKTLRISDTTLIGLTSFGGVILVLGTIPLAWLADRLRRVSIMTISVIAAAIGVMASGLVANSFALFWARNLVGAGHAYRLPVHSSLLADQYPIESRARVFGFEGLGRPVGQLLAPVAAGAAAAAIGGPSAWRWVFVLFAIPVALLGLLTLILKEPKRGINEQQVLLGGELAPVARELPISISSAFQRLKKIRTFYYMCIGIGTLGFALVAVPVQLSLLFDKVYHYGAYTRGWVTALTWLPSILAIPIAGSRFDRIFRENPARLVRLAGTLVIAYGVLMFAGLRFQNVALLVAGIGLANACTSSAFVSIGPIIGAVAPARMRAQAFALVPVFIFLMGGFFGGLLAGSLSDSLGQRTALSIIAPPAGIIGGLLLGYGSRFIRRDIALMSEELIEEQAERQRIEANPDDVPVLQVRNLDASYGPVQVLFGAELDVYKGEVVALLGSNGAGKSTLLRCISGITMPDRGVVRLNGRTITYTEAELRFNEGILQVRGGAGTFRNLTVEENLRASLMGTVTDRADVDRRIEEVYETFPSLRRRRTNEARSLSGGEQQMLAVGMSLAHEPEVLIIDELSLGLAPLVVQTLIDVVERLKERHVTMLIVEQSLNIALSIADRAVFMEKGAVKFSGTAAELRDRDDLVQAAFLGGHGTA
jgi:ABC-type branched-subunit amino acid transport system ATPase component